MKHINSTVVVTNKEEEKCEQELQAPELSLLKGKVYQMLTVTGSKGETDMCIFLLYFLCEFAICHTKTGARKNTDLLLISILKTSDIITNVS